MTINLIAQGQPIKTINLKALRQPQRTINHAMRQPKRQTINHAYQKIFRILRRLSHCMFDGPQGLFQSLKVSKSLNYNVHSHFWLSIIKLYWTFQGLIRIMGLAIVLDVANFIAQKTLDFPKASLKIVYQDWLRLCTFQSNTPNKSKYLISMKFLEK